MAEQSPEDIAKILARLPKRIPAMFGDSGAELKAISTQIVKRDKEMLFETKIIAAILRDMKRILINIRTLASQSMKDLVKKVSEEKPGGGGPGFGTGLLFSRLLTGRIGTLITGALSGVVARISGILAALGPVGIGLSLALIGATVASFAFLKATGAMRDEALAFGETLRGISPAITAIQVQRDLATRFRKMRVGAQIAPEQQALIQSQIRLEDAMEKFTIVGQKINATIGTFGNEVKTWLAEKGSKLLALAIQAVDFAIPGQQETLEEMVKILEDIRDKDLDIADRGVTRQILEGLAGARWREHQIHTYVANANMDMDKGAKWDDPIWRRQRDE